VRFVKGVYSSTPVPVALLHCDSETGETDGHRWWLARSPRRRGSPLLIERRTAWRRVLGECGQGIDAADDIAAAALSRGDCEALPMPKGSYSLGGAAAKLHMIRLTCPKCHRSGQYRADRLLEKYGPDIAMPDLRHELAECPRRHDMGDPCQVEYVDRLANL
jgi:hypothetical protein